MDSPRITTQRGPGILLKLLLIISNSGRTIIVLFSLCMTTATIGYAHFEHKDMLTSFWWSVVTGFTVGYGDEFPKTDAGRYMAVAFIPAISMLWALVLAHIITKLLLDQDAFTHDEQERYENALVMSLIMQGILPPDATELPPPGWRPDNWYELVAASQFVVKARFAQ